MDFVLGKIEEIEHVLQLVDPRNPNMDLVKVRQALMARQSITVRRKQSEQAWGDVDVKVA